MVSVAPTTLPPHSLAHNSFEARMSLSPGGCGATGSNATGHMASRKRGKLEVCDAFLARLRERESFDLDDFSFVEGVQQHFRILPSRYALDVNIASLDVLNHKRLLDSARADPSALSFQVRPIDVISAAGAQADPSRRPSFSSSDAPLTEVHLEGLACSSVWRNVSQSTHTDCCDCARLLLQPAEVLSLLASRGPPLGHRPTCR